MTAKEWVGILEEELKEMPKKDRDGVISYYNEMIADVLESGVDEEEFVFTLGNPSDVAKKILAENGINYTDKEENLHSQTDGKPQTPPRSNANANQLPIWSVIILGFMGFLVVFPLLITCFSLIVAFWACFGAFVASSFGGVILLFVSIGMAISGAVQSGWGLIGATVFAMGIFALLAVVFWYLSIYLTKATVWGAKTLLKGVKTNER